MKSLSREKLAVTVLRCAIGWHFIYEGILKLAADNWSAAGYLSGATGPFAGFYHWIASSDALLFIVNQANMFGLLFIGLGLFLGVAVRMSTLAGILLLTLYYFAYPPFLNSGFSTTANSHFGVNSIAIEAMALVVLFFLKEKGYQFNPAAFMRTMQQHVIANQGGEITSRREALLNLATLPALGIMGGCAYYDNQKHQVDGYSGATIQVGALDISELKGELPKGKIGHHTISRLVMGGNLIGGWAHARDLIYVPALFRAYNTEQKVFETLALAEKAGIDTINIGFPSNTVLKKYKDETGSSLQIISQVAPDMQNNNYFTQINEAIDYGVDVLQIQGNWCDWLVRDNKLDVIAAMLDNIQSQGYVAGLGAHTVDALVRCEEEGIIPDYYMLTMHHDQYWSAHPKEFREPFEVDVHNHLDHNRFHDNMFCSFPERTIEFVQRTRVPVMGFKVLAAGAIAPQDGFNWAFSNGADFICVGMFDFQIVNDVNIAIDVLEATLERSRLWLT